MTVLVRFHCNSHVVTVQLCLQQYGHLSIKVTFAQSHGDRISEVPPYQSCYHSAIVSPAIRSLLPSHMGDRISEVPLYMDVRFGLPLPRLPFSLPSIVVSRVS